MELNASDTRSKNSLKDIVAESLNNTSIKGFYSSMWLFEPFPLVKQEKQVHFNV